MSDILIRGMEMPEDGECVVVFSDGVAQKYKAEGIAFYEYKAQTEEAVAVQLPEHGRLIDADAMAAKDTAEYEEAMNFTRDLSTLPLFDCAHREVQKAIKNAPTIIPEEGGDAE